MPDFFEEVDGLTIVENHAREVVALEDEKAEAMLRRYNAVRRELEKRLKRLDAEIPGPAPTFTQYQLRGTLTQVRAAIDAMTEALKSGMEEHAVDLAMKGVKDQLAELKRFEQHFTGGFTPIRLDVQQVAADTQNFLLNKHASSLEAYGQDLIDTITSRLTSEMLMGDSLHRTIKSMSDVRTRIGSFFEGEEWKLHRIARTELHGIYSLAKLNGMRTVNNDYFAGEGEGPLMKALYHRVDKRTGKDSLYLLGLNPIMPIDEPFKYTWKGKERSFMQPPDRPNDRAILIPYRQEWVE